MSLKHLIYISTATAAGDESELPSILEVSVRNNKPQAVTGMLLYTKGHFMQVLEGDPQALADIYARIEQDLRHTDLVVLADEHIAKRNFSQWNMGYRKLSNSDIDANPAWAPFFAEGFNASAIGAKPGAALSMLKLFAQT
jgi:hypothetical protein